jgi:hypothetical protein
VSAGRGCSTASPDPLREGLRRAHGTGLGGVGCLDGSVDKESLRLLKVMREQLGETTGRAVDAGALSNPGRILRGVRRARHELA